MSISIKPLEDRIVIRQVEAEQTTASGLVIPDTAKEKPQEGEVIAVGPGRVDDNGCLLYTSCPNASAMLFTSAKVTHLGLLPQGKPENYKRVVNMLNQMDEELSLIHISSMRLALPARTRPFSRGFPPPPQTSRPRSRPTSTCPCRGRGSSPTSAPPPERLAAPPASTSRSTQACPAPAPPSPTCPPWPRPCAWPQLSLIHI